DLLLACPCGAAGLPAPPLRSCFQHTRHAPHHNRAPRAASCRVTLLAPIWRAGQAAPHGLDVAAGRRGTAPPRGGGRAGRVASRRPPRDGVPPRARNEPEPVSDAVYAATGRRSKRAAARFAPRPGPAA